MVCPESEGRLEAVWDTLPDSVKEALELGCEAEGAAEVDRVTLGEVLPL